MACALEVGGWRMMRCSQLIKIEVRATCVLDNQVIKNVRTCMPRGGLGAGACCQAGARPRLRQGPGGWLSACRRFVAAILAPSTRCEARVQCEGWGSSDLATLGIAGYVIFFRSKVVLQGRRRAHSQPPPSAS